MAKKTTKWSKETHFQLLSLIVSVLTLITLILGFRFANTQLRTMEKSLYCNSLLTYQEKWTSVLFEDSRAKISEIGDVKLEHFYPGTGKKRTGECLAVRRLSAFFELMGWAIYNKYIKFDDVKTLYGSALNHYWNKFQKAIVDFRKEVKDDAIYEHFENFANSYQKYIDAAKAMKNN